MSLAVDPAARFLYVTNFGSGTVTGYRINSGIPGLADGSLTGIAGSPFSAGGQARGITIDPLGRFVYVSLDNGSQVLAYAINPSNGSLSSVAGSPFSTPHLTGDLVVDPGGTYLYVAGDGVSIFQIQQATGALVPVTGPAPYSASGGRGIDVDPLGRFVYVAHSSDHTVSGYSISPATGALTPVPNSPYTGVYENWIACVHPGGRFLYVQGSGGIQGYLIDPASGALNTMTGFPLSLNNANSIYIDRSGLTLYATTSGASLDFVRAFSINTTTGALTEISGSPYAPGAWPFRVVSVGVVQ